MVRGTVPPPTDERKTLVSVRDRGVALFSVSARPDSSEATAYYGARP